jgi:hypothetical protein
MTAFKVGGQGRGGKIVSLPCNVFRSETFDCRGLRFCSLAVKRRDLFRVARDRMENTHEKPSICSRLDDGKCSRSSDGTSAPGRRRDDERTGRTRLYDGTPARRTTAGRHNGPYGCASRSCATGQLSTLFADSDRWMYPEFGSRIRYEGRKASSSSSPQINRRFKFQSGAWSKGRRHSCF